MFWIFFSWVCCCCFIFWVLFLVSLCKLRNNGDNCLVPLTLLKWCKMRTQNVCHCFTVLKVRGKPCLRACFQWNAFSICICFIMEFWQIKHSVSGLLSNHWSPASCAYLCQEPTGNANKQCRVISTVFICTGYLYPHLTSVFTRANSFQQFNSDPLCKAPHLFKCLLKCKSTK